jgi:hypothetical protein
MDLFIGPLAVYFRTYAEREKFWNGQMYYRIFQEDDRGIGQITGNVIDSPLLDDLSNMYTIFET